MHKLNFRPDAEKDLKEIMRFYAVERNNPAFAVRLADELREVFQRLREFPYANPVFLSRLPLKYTYRTALVRDYLIFYRISEPRKTITITRVLYAKMNYERYLT